MTTEAPAIRRPYRSAAPTLLRSQPYLSLLARARRPTASSMLEHSETQGKLTVTFFAVTFQGKPAATAVEHVVLSGLAFVAYSVFDGPLDCICTHRNFTRLPKCLSSMLQGCHPSTLKAAHSFPCAGRIHGIPLTLNTRHRFASCSSQNDDRIIDTVKLCLPADDI